MKRRRSASPGLDAAPATASDDWHDFARSVGVATVVSIGRVQAPAARPLSVQRVAPDGRVAFFLSAGSALARQLASEADVALVFIDKRVGRYLVLNGRASLRHDPDFVAHRRAEHPAASFPGGPQEPDPVVLEVDTSQAQMWQPDGTRVEPVLKVAAAAIGLAPGRVGRVEYRPAAARRGRARRTK